MRLLEIIQSDEEIVAWFEPASGPEDIQGVRLVYFQPIGPYYAELIQNAQDDDKPQRVERLQQMKTDYEKSGQKYFTPGLGWWMSEESFRKGEQVWMGATKGKILAKYPNLQIVSSRQEAAQKI